MSTPTTATATLPHYHPHHYPPSYPHTHTHSHHQAYSTNTSASYRTPTTNNPILPPVTSSPSSSTTVRLPPPYQTSSVAYSSASNGITQPSAARPAPAHDPTPRQDANYSAPAMETRSTAEQPSRKRRRSREPDWGNFYKNGLPREIIVIDDTPEPEANTGRKITNGVTTVQADATTTTRPTAKKRRRDDEPDTSQNPGYHVKYLGSQHNTPLNNSTPSGSTLSSDRTNSGANTTAPTSLDSTRQFEEAQAPLKRKRTRQQAANEAKRRDVDGLGDPFFTYKPPPYPPKKAGEVNVRVVHDVSSLTRQVMQRNSTDIFCEASLQQERQGR